MKSSVKVLIVEDDKSSAQSISDIVKKAGFKPVVVNKSVDALNIVRLQTVHAAIVDVLLPKVTGGDLVQEFRKTKFGDNPVILVSGVFKDKSFTQELLKKTGALDYLTKPFTLEEMTGALNRALANTVGADKATVQSLLTRKLSTVRDWIKAIEGLDDIKGLDFPFVLSVLMGIESSGHLNIVNESGEIFGINVMRGRVTDVDSAESQATAVLKLISAGYLSQEDWDEFQRSGAKRFSLDTLIQEGIVSPHAVSKARFKQIESDLMEIFSSPSLQINFSPQEQTEDAPPHAVNMEDLMDVIGANLNDLFNVQYLQDFYLPIRHAPIRFVKTVQELDRVWNSGPFRDLQTLKESFSSGATLDQALQLKPNLENRIYACLHFLVLNRAIMFDDLNMVRSMGTMVERYAKLLAEIENKTADKIFEYFGAPLNASPKAFQGIFEEYARNNSPDSLGPEATPELKALCQKCFDIVNGAREIMTDDLKRQKLIDQIAREEDSKQKQAANLLLEAIASLRKGQATQALALLQQAEGLHVTTKLHILKVWAEIKAGGPALNRARLIELSRLLDGVPSEARKDAIYCMSMGLLKKAQGDPSAPGYFEKALQFDPEFQEAKRELKTPIASKGTQSKKVDLFTGDITEVVSQIFRRKID